MEITEVTNETLPEALRLLSGNNLPVNDITASTKLFVLFDAGAITGTVAVEHDGTSGLLRSLSVAVQSRSMGYGDKLVQYIEAYSREQGLRDLYLLTTTAEQYFLKKHYKAVDRHTLPEYIRSTSEFTSVCPASAVAMKKTL